MLCFLDTKGVSEQSELGLLIAEVLGGQVGTIRFWDWARREARAFGASGL